MPYGSLQPKVDRRDLATAVQGLPKGVDTTLMRGVYGALIRSAQYGFTMFYIRVLASFLERFYRAYGCFLSWALFKSIGLGMLLLMAYCQNNYSFDSAHGPTGMGTYLLVRASGSRAVRASSCRKGCWGLWRHSSLFRALTLRLLHKADLGPENSNWPMRVVAETHTYTVSANEYARGGASMPRIFPLEP